MCSSKLDLSMVLLVGLSIFANIITKASCQDDSKNIELLEEYGRCNAQKRSCNCDEDCQNYGDCCFDYPLFNETEQRKAHESFKCVHSFIVNQGLYMVAKCPPHWSGNRTRGQCESFERNIDDPLTSEPVASRNTSTLYRNAHCAYCNNVQEFDFYGVHVVCQKATHQQNESLEYERSNVMNTGGDMNETSDDSFANCNFVSSYDTVGAYIHIEKLGNSKYFNFRLCIPDAIGTCPNDWSDDNVRDMCEIYTMYIEGSLSNRVYRNPYCQACTSVTTPLQTNLSNHNLGQSFSSSYIPIEYPYLWSHVPKAQRLMDKGTLEYIRFLLTNGYQVKSNNSYSRLIYKFSKQFDYFANPEFSPLIIWLISTILLLSFHVLIFALSPPQNKTLLDYNLASYCSALLITYIPMFLILISNDGYVYYFDSFFIALSIYGYYATLIWMLTLSFDVCRSTRAAVKCLQRESAKDARRRFIVYALRSWFMSGLMGMITLISYLLSIWLHDQDREERFEVWFMTWLKGLTTVVTIFNLFFFSHTFYMICKSWIKPRCFGTPSNLIQLSDFGDIGETSQRCNTVNVKEMKKRARTFTILALQMGLVSMVGLLALFYIPPRHTPELYFTILSTCDSFLIVLFFTCKKEKIAAIKRKINYFQT